MDIKSFNENDISYQKHPLIYFLVFAIANSLLAYGSQVLEIKLWIFLVGILFPFLLAVSTNRVQKKREIPDYELECFPSIPMWLWILIFVFAIFIRVGQIYAPDYWPLPDEGYNAYPGVQLSNQWSWDIFLGPAQHPPLSYWFQALFFKLFTPSLHCMWFFQALSSIGILFLSWLSARLIFSKSVSFLFCFLVGFSFWPLFTGKIFGYMALFIFWEMGAFVLLAYFLRRDSSAEKTKILFALGSWCALGFFVAITWPLVVLAISIVVIKMNQGELVQREKMAWLFSRP